MLEVKGHYLMVVVMEAVGSHQGKLHKCYDTFKKRMAENETQITI